MTTLTFKKKRNKCRRTRTEIRASNGMGCNEIKRTILDSFRKNKQTWATIISCIAINTKTTTT
jgi:hypothetical protein